MKSILTSSAFFAAALVALLCLSGCSKSRQIGKDHTDPSTVEGSQTQLMASVTLRPYTGMNYKDFRRISERHRPYSWVREPGGRHFHRKITVIKII